MYMCVCAYKCMNIFVCCMCVHVCATAEKELEDTQKSRNAKKKAEGRAEKEKKERKGTQLLT